MAIPFTRYLNIRNAYGPSYSPDGTRLAFLTNITGVPQVWAVNSEGGWPDQITYETERVSQARFSPARDELVFLRDIGGNENAQIFLVNGDGVVPDERDLVRRRDRRGLIHHGVIFFVLEKLGAVAGRDAGVLAWDSTDASGGLTGVHSR